MAARTARPPITPPTIAPIGALAGEDVCVGVGLPLVLVLDAEVKLDVVELTVADDVVFAATDIEIATGLTVR